MTEKDNISAYTMDGSAMLKTNPLPVLSCQPYYRQPHKANYVSIHKVSHETGIPDPVLLIKSHAIARARLQIHKGQRSRSAQKGQNTRKHDPRASANMLIRWIILVLCEYLDTTRTIHHHPYVYIIDQAGWILAEFSSCVFMGRDEVEVHKNVLRERGQYQANILTELAWSIKYLLYGIKSTEKNDLPTCLFSSTEKEPS